MYDLFTRFPLLVWASFCALRQTSGLFQFWETKSPIDFIYVLHFAMRLSTVAFLLLVAAVVIVRTRASGKASGLEPRIAALVGSFMTYGIALFPHRDISFSSEMASTSLILIGTAGSVVALFQLGRSFSIMAETRQLVTGGPYRIIRHPLYLTEGIAILGLYIQFASAWTTLLLAVQIACQLRRMHYEEMVLSADFPEYDFYKQNTARLIPGVY